MRMSNDQITRRQSHFAERAKAERIAAPAMIQTTMAVRPGGSTEPSEPGTQIKGFWITKEPKEGVPQDYYDIRPDEDEVEWANSTSEEIQNYVVDDLVYRTNEDEDPDPEELWYLCIKEHNAGGDEEWDEGAIYVEGERVWVGTPNSDTWLCIAEGGSTMGVEPSEGSEWTLDNDNPPCNGEEEEPGNHWDTYWKENDLKASWVTLEGVDDDANKYVPILTETDYVWCIAGKEGDPYPWWIISPSLYFADGKSIAWNRAQHRIMAVFR